MKIDITEEQITQLLEDVKQEFVALQKSESEDAEKLAKADDGPPEDDKPAEAAPEAPAAQEAAPAGPVDDAPPEAPAVDLVVEAGVSPEDLSSMYSKLSDEDLSMHYMACSKALFSRMNGEGDAEEAPPAPGADMPQEAAPEAPAAPAADEGDPMMDKSHDISDEIAEAFAHLESENKTLRDESDALKKKLDELAETMTKLVARPVRSGFTSGSVIEAAPKSPEPLTKSEVIAKLNEKAKGQLSVPDREKLIKFSLNPVLTEELSKFLEENK